MGELCPLAPDKLRPCVSAYHLFAFRNVGQVNRIIMMLGYFTRLKFVNIATKQAWDEVVKSSYS